MFLLGKTYSLGHAPDPLDPAEEPDPVSSIAAQVPLSHAPGVRMTVVVMKSSSIGGNASIRTTLIGMYRSKNHKQTWYGEAEDKNEEYDDKSCYLEIS